MNDSLFEPRTIEECTSADYHASPLTHAQRALQEALDAPLGDSKGAATYRERKLHKLRNKLTLAEVDRLLTIQETRWMQDMQDGHADGFGATNVCPLDAYTGHRLACLRAHRHGASS
ncbi:hypothetical protein [Streptomyces avermitilis]|uniref:hypothetical protein n=1 Tax=Streptomyces avermitilis TaxID=33903 RepID=UPI0033B42F00